MLDIRPITAAGHAAWLPLWQGYQRFYNATIADDTSALTWQRFLDRVDDDIARDGSQRRRRRASHDRFGLGQGGGPGVRLDLDFDRSRDHAGSSRSGVGRPRAASAS